MTFVPDQEIRTRPDYYIPDRRNTTVTMSVSFPARHRPRLYDSQYEQHAGLRLGVAVRAEEFYSDELQATLLCRARKCTKRPGCLIHNEYLSSFTGRVFGTVIPIARGGEHD